MVRHLINLIYLANKNEIGKLIICVIIFKRKKCHKRSLIHEERHNNHKCVSTKSRNIRIRMKVQNLDTERQS